MQTQTAITEAQLPGSDQSHAPNLAGTKVFAPGICAPTGLYWATAQSIDGPWDLLNGHGLVMANPARQSHALPSDMMSQVGQRLI